MDMDEAGRAVVIEREIPFPRTLVWKALTDPAHVNEWWGPEGFSNVEVQFDFRVGGTWSYVMVGPDGTRYPNHNLFKVIAPETRIVYDAGDGETVWFEASIDLVEIPNGTRVVLRHLFPSQAFRDEVVEKYHAIEGGKQHLAKLEAYVGAHLA